MLNTWTIVLLYLILKTIIDTKNIFIIPCKKNFIKFLANILKNQGDKTLATQCNYCFCYEYTSKLLRNKNNSKELSQKDNSLKYTLAE